MVDRYFEEWIGYKTHTDSLSLTHTLPQHLHTFPPSHTEGEHTHCPSDMGLNTVIPASGPSTVSPTWTPPPLSPPCRPQQQKQHTHTHRQTHSRQSSRSPHTPPTATPISSTKEKGPKRTSLGRAFMVGGSVPMVTGGVSAEQFTSGSHEESL